MAVGWHITNRADIFGRPGEHCRSGWGHPANRPGGPPAAGQDSPRAGFAKGRFPAKAGIRQGQVPGQGEGFRKVRVAQGRGIHGSRRRGYGMAVPGPARGGVCLARGECDAGSHNKIQMEEIRK